MAHFYGYLHGRGTVTRTGHKTTGISARLESSSHTLDTRLYHQDGEDFAVVEIDGREVYRGPFAPPK